MLTPYERFAGADPKAIQDRIDLYLSKLTAKPGHDTVQYDDVVLTPGVQNCLEHGLQRDWIGYRIVANDTGATIFYDSAAAQDRSLYLVLGCDILCAVSVEVF